MEEGSSKKRNVIAENVQNHAKITSFQINKAAIVVADSPGNKRVNLKHWIRLHTKQPDYCDRITE